MNSSSALLVRQNVKFCFVLKKACNIHLIIGNCIKCFYSVFWCRYEKSQEEFKERVRKDVEFAIENVYQSKDEDNDQHLIRYVLF